MPLHLLKQVVIGASVIAAQWAVPVTLAQGIREPQAIADNDSTARAARRAARTAADVASSSARTATRREPMAALKGIAQTRAEKNVTGWIAEKFLDRAELLGRNDRNACRCVGGESTILADIATLRLEQRAELRATLTPLKQVQFDANIALLIAKEG